MKILKQKQKEIYGNDCMIYNNIALIESLGRYIVIRHKVTTGLGSYNDSETVDFHSYDKALEIYKLFVKSYL